MTAVDRKPRDLDAITETCLLFKPENMCPLKTFSAWQLHK